ncbi:MAG: UDP-3-O-(3-hydroxymyristoyl)glucosamine N-acyltransferase [Phycisphaerales bacterium]|nr:UDP-3-O-(3-hydroxymyristoyl)glucosamine N-acyltransferase [Phycisphaerales bacterium]
MTTQGLAQMLGAQIVGRGDLALSDLAPIDTAKAGSLTFIRSDEYARRWADSHASAALVSRGIEVPGHDPQSRALLFVDSADQALVVLLAQISAIAAPPPPIGVHPAAVVHPSASIDPSASIGPLCNIEADVTIGPAVVLHARVSVGKGSRIGEATTLHPGAVLYPATIVGRRCIIHANAVIGADGFGFLPHPSGSGHVKIPHLGNVVIGDDVEIGSCTCIDRAKMGSTTISDGAKLDNLVQIGHNCTIGRHVILCGQVGIAGSCNIHEGVIFGGQAGMHDGITVGANARVGGQGGVTKDLEPGAVVWGTPARPLPEYMRSIALLAMLSGRLKDLKSRVASLEKARNNEHP